MLTTTPRRSLLLAALISAFILAAPIAARAADTCGLLTTQQIAAATQDLSVRAGSGGPSDCIWSGKHATIYLTIRDSGNWPTAKGAFQRFGQIESVSGVGSDAFFQGPTNPKPTFYALKGAHYIILRVNVTGFSADQTKAALKALATDALAKL